MSTEDLSFSLFRMSAVQAAAPGAMDGCNQMGVPQLKGAFAGFTGFTIAAAFFLNVLAVVAAFMPWSKFLFPNLYSINFGLKYFFLLYEGPGSSIATTGGGLLYLDPLCPYYFGTLAFVGGTYDSTDSVYALGTNLCKQCDTSNTWSFMWLASTSSWWFFIFLCSYVACCRCICCCNWGTYSRSVLFVMGLITLALTAGAKGQNSDCNASIAAWSNYLLSNPDTKAAFPNMALTTNGIGTSLGAVCIALSVMMLLLTVVFPWPTGRFANEVDQGLAAQGAGLDNKAAPGAPAYPGAAPAYPRM